jgi:hypothetical protein
LGLPLARAFESESEIWALILQSKFALLTALDKSS